MYPEAERVSIATGPAAYRARGQYHERGDLIQFPAQYQQPAAYQEALEWCRRHVSRNVAHFFHRMIGLNVTGKLGVRT